MPDTAEPPGSTEPPLHRGERASAFENAPIQTLLDFHGKTVVITGAANGIGAACAHRFAEAGASLVLVDRDVPAAQRLSEVLPNAVALPLDITTPDAPARIVEHALSSLQRAARSREQRWEVPALPDAGDDASGLG